jgi:cysteine desulfurase family protein
MDTDFIYMDHAATTFPRPPEVLDRMTARYRQMGCSPGRGGYDMAVEAGQYLHQVRERIAAGFGAPDPDRVVFTSNATDALNLAILGMTRPGDHVVSTRLEHNSVLRPLHHLRQAGRIDFTLVEFDDLGIVTPEAIAGAIHDHTRLVVVNHASNVLGTVQPIAGIGQVCRHRGIPLVIDAAQSAGFIPIDMAAWHVSALAFTGHKALLGPTGTGGLVTLPDVWISPTRFGGTGVESLRLEQPEAFPHRLESGTLNLLGIIGLDEGLTFLETSGIRETVQRKTDLATRLWQGLAAIDGVTVYGTAPGPDHVPLVTCNIKEIRPSDAGMILDGDYGIAVRTGLHCAPLVHETIGTSPEGAVRFSLGWNTTKDQVDQAIQAVKEMADGRS